jgi:hypothetical protein
MHAQSPRKIEYCAELGRSGRLTGSLRVPALAKVKPARTSAQVHESTAVIFYALFISTVVDPQRGLMLELQRWLYAEAGGQIR